MEADFQACLHDMHRTRSGPRETAALHTQTTCSGPREPGVAAALTHPISHTRGALANVLVFSDRRTWFCELALGRACGLFGSGHGLFPWKKPGTHVHTFR